MAKKIYISSTFGDLAAYRENIRQTISFLSDYFTVVRTMEYMLPGSENTILAECLSDVEKCDIYILIIGKRYGSIEKTTQLSFTENEFRHASLKKKIIIPLVADEKAEILSTIPTDNEQEYARFKQDIQNSYQTFIKLFTNPFHLSTQLLLSLYKFANKKWIINDDVKYFCNRSTQYHSFMGVKKKERLNVLTVVGKTDDCADYFSKRMGKYEFGLMKEYIEQPIRASILSGSSDYEKHKIILISHLMDNFLDKNDDRPSSVAECFDYLIQKKINNIFVNLYLTQEDIKSDKLKLTLEKFFEELREKCFETKITIFYLIIFQFNNDEKIDERIGNWIINNKKINKQPANVRDIEALSVIELQEVQDWIKQYVSGSDANTVEDEQRISNVLDTYFDKEHHSQNMKKTFLILTELINTINEKR